MRMTEKLRERLPAMLPLLLELPHNQHFDIDHDEIQFQCETQAAVRRLRECFPGVLWTKEYSEGCQWWEYTGKYDSFNVRIYAVKEAPPTCRAIEEEVEVEEKIPVLFETRVVKKKVIHWDCSGGGAAAAVLIICWLYPALGWVCAA